MSRGIASARVTLPATREVIHREADTRRDVAAGELRGEMVGREVLPTLLPAWHDLCGRSVEDNVYYAPKYAQALLNSVEADRDVRFATVWDETRLVALLPIVRSRFAIPMVQPRGKAWQSKYTFSCMPLLDRICKLEAAEALVEVLAGAGQDEWILPTINIRGEASRMFVLALEKRGAPWALANYFARAVLDKDCSYEEHIKRHVSSNRRKSLGRNRRRLEELGSLKHHGSMAGEDLTHAVSAFLKLEAGGWKGKRGTALACDERTRAFAMDAFSGKADNPICRADVLTLDDKPIAVSLIALLGNTGFAVKSAYDEAYRTYSPGLLLELEVVRSFLSGNWALRLDGATAGAHAIDELWSGHVEVADLIFSLSPGRAAALRLRTVQRIDRLQRTIRSTAGQLIKRLVRS